MKYPGFFSLWALSCISIGLFLAYRAGVGFNGLVFAGIVMSSLFSLFFIVLFFLKK